MDSKISGLIDLVSQPETVKSLEEHKKFNLDDLNEEYKVSESEIEDLYEWCRLRYECGLYQHSGEVLRYYRNLTNNKELKYRHGRYNYIWYV